MTLAEEAGEAGIASSPPAPAVKIMRLRYAGVCACGTEVLAGTRAGWDRSDRRVVCNNCLAAPPDSAGNAELEPVTGPPAAVAPPAVTPAIGPSADSANPAEGRTRTAARGVPDDAGTVQPPVDVGRPGASLEEEYRRRKQGREDRIRGKHPRLGGLILAVTDEPATTKAFAIGADGERRIAARLEKDCGADVLFLHNRKLGHGRRDGDVDHIAIAPSGVYVIDAKRYQNAAVRVQRTGGFLSPVKAQLMVAGRDRTKLLDGCAKQLAAVLAALDEAGDGQDVAVTSVLCFVDADLPLWGAQELRGVRLLGPRGTSKLLRRPGSLTEPERRSLHSHLAAALPPA